MNANLCWHSCRWQIRQARFSEGHLGKDVPSVHSMLYVVKPAYQVAIPLYLSLWEGNLHKIHMPF